ncbi:hypothetical protein [Salmonella enterica]|uniref:hypothetical protein n=1 Tax=Salmonella enterica TaxID=28901 RepID=UPI00352E0EA4
MSTITKERIANLIEFNSEGSDCQANAEQWEVHELARIALTSLEAEPVADVVAWSSQNEERTCDIRWRRFDVAPGPLYTSPPAPVVPDEMVNNIDNPCGDEDLIYEEGKIEGWNACRAAMLQAGNSPVTPDDVRRMDWLVSKTVNVREPMVYGSHSLFWSQTITDEEDDYHATKLREQIDEAMADERAAAPQQEVNNV